MKRARSVRKLTAKHEADLRAVLQTRFEQNPSRHAGLTWTDVEARLAGAAAKLWSLNEMEATGGEPDVVGRDAETGEILFYDCAPQSPAGRQSVCYDRAGLESRKEHRPKNTAVDMATAMGTELLTPEEYRALQALGEFDTKSSSWVKTPADIRERGGALFGDRRFGHVFIYHNGAQSYYGGRGFRSVLRV